MGGMIAQVAAARRPEALDALILMDTTHGPLHIDPELAMLGAEIVRGGGMAAVTEAMDALDAEAPPGTPAHERPLAERPGYRAEGARRSRGTPPTVYSPLLG